jgi:undecaprenyl pyrophosphate synthase
MLKFSKKFAKKIAKENEISFEIFGNILFVKMEFQNEIMKKKKNKQTKQNKIKQIVTY